MSLFKTAINISIPINYLVLSLLLLLPSAAFACSGLSDRQISVGSATIDNTNLPLLSFTPKVRNQKLTISGNENSIRVSFYNRCEIFDLNDYNGVHIQLLNSGEEYDGSQLNAFQQVYGGNGDDVIKTGNQVDYIFAGAGNDRVFSSGHRDKVDAGTGMDCVEKGANGTSVAESITNQELDSCSNHAQAVTKLQSCPASGSGNRALLTHYRSGKVWGLNSSLSNNRIRIEQFGDYLFATVTNRRNSFCIGSTANETSLIFAKLTAHNDNFDGSGVEVNMTVYGYEGNDTITTGNGNDFIIGGSGNDTIRGKAGVDWILGDTRIETRIKGVEWQLSDSGDSGRDIIYGDDGDDVIFGNGNNDNIYGGNGNDLIYGNSGKTDKLYGNNGDDLIVANGGDKWSKRARMWGGDGHDIIICSTGECYMSGGNNADGLLQLGNKGDIQVAGGDGADYIYIRGDRFPAGTGGSGQDLVNCDGCYSTIGNVGYFNSRADVSDAANNVYSRINSQFRVSLQLNRSVRKKADRFRKRFANLTDQEAYEFWQSNRHLNIHEIHQRM